MSTTKNKTPWVNASEVGSASYCPKALEYRHRGVRPTRQAQQKQRKGNVHHARETKAAYQQQRQQDKRCFVASYALGQDHPVTQSLRDWRDESLKQTAAGRAFVRIYYLVSPLLIRALGQSKLFRKISKEAVLWLATKVAK